MTTTVLDVQRFKDEGRRFAVLTAYDYLSAQILDEAGVALTALNCNGNVCCTTGYSKNDD